MFDKYGEFDSAAELIQAIQGQIDEGDMDAAFEIGRENGLEDDDILDIADGVPIEEVLTPCITALGKLQIEAKAYQKNDSSQHGNRYAYPKKRLSGSPCSRYRAKTASADGEAASRPRSGRRPLSLLLFL